VAEAGQLASVLTPVSNRPSVFTAAPQAVRVFSASHDAAVTFEPLYRVHDDRAYAVYWDTFTPEEWQVREERAAFLAAVTVDRVLPGDEESERAHNMQGENTATGEGKWRHATDGGWFSWDLQGAADTPLELHVTYWGSDSGGREFDVLVNDQQVATQTLDNNRPDEYNNRPDEFYDEVYQLPPALTQGQERLTIKFQAHPGRMAGGVFGVALRRVQAPPPPAVPAKPEV